MTAARARYPVVSDNTGAKVMSGKIFVWLLAIFLLTAAPSTDAQQPTKVPRIGYLTVASLASNVARVAAFKQGLRELGYVEGKNIVIEWRSAEGKFERQGELAAELVRQKVDVIVSSGPTMTQAAKEATTTIPIVMAQDSDPVGNGFVASLARPGGNITGLSVLSPELSGKQLELLKEILPKLSRVAVLGNSNEPANAKTLKEIESAAKSFGVQVQSLDAQAQKDIAPAFRVATKTHPNAILVLASAIVTDHRTQVANLALKSRLPAIYGSSIWVNDGGLMSYGTSLVDLSRRAATYVDKILKGAKPADLPVEQPIKFEFVINLKAAKHIGLTIPPNVLARADKVIK
jgi:putative ABC transport system substrate-binding protein